jgi:hypothetical protein
VVTPRQLRPARAQASAESGETERRQKTLGTASELVNAAAKWLIGSLGVVGAILVAGSQLSSIGSLPIGGRLALAAGGLALGLAAVMWSIWRVVDLLAPDRYTISELCREWSASGAVRGVGVSRAGQSSSLLRRRLARSQSGASCGT